MPGVPDQLAELVQQTVDRATTPRHTYEDVAESVAMSVKTIMRWVKAGQVPSPVYLGSTARFTDSQLATIAGGPALPGFYTIADSPRASRAKQSNPANVKRAKEAKRKRDARAKAKQSKEGGAS